MTKKELAQMEALRLQLAEARALRWPDYKPVALDVHAIAARLAFNEVFPAWTFNAFSKVVQHGCFGRVYHSTHSSIETNSQGRGGPWFATRIEALQALRLSLTKTYATDLGAIDYLIESAPAT